MLSSLTYCSRSAPILTAIPPFILILLPAVDAIGQAEDRRAVLGLILNEQPKGDIVVRLRGADILALVEDLENAGLGHFDGHRETLADRPFVSSIRCVRT